MLNLLLDAFLLLIFLVLTATAVIVRFVFPPGVDSEGWRLWGYGYHQWSTFQFAIIALMALAVLVHVMLHWSWVCGIVVTRWKRDKKAKLDDGAQTIYGVGLLIVLLNIVGLVIAAAALSIQRPQ